MPRHDLFRHILVASFLITLTLEWVAVWTHNYTLTDWILENISMKWRVVILAWMVYHFLFAYPSYR
jgi:hypothetical protein